MIAIWGVLFGFAAMTRSNVVFMPLIVGLAMYLVRHSWKNIIYSTLLVFLIMQAVNLPWVIRNKIIFGVPVIYTANSHFIYCGLLSGKPDGSGGVVPKPGEPGYSVELQYAIDHHSNQSTGQRQKLCSQLITKWIITHPLKFLWLGVRRVLLFILPGTYGGCWPIWFQYYPGHCTEPLALGQRVFFYALAMQMYTVIFLSALASGFKIQRNWYELKESKRISIILVATCIGFWLLEHMIIFPEKKHRFPIISPRMSPLIEYAIIHPTIRDTKKPIT